MNPEQPSLYLFDTTLLIDIARGNGNAATVASDLSRQGVAGTSVVNVAECLRGAHARERPFWDQMFGTLTVWPLDVTDAKLAGRTMYQLARAGFQVAIADALIAATARRVQATVVTNNVRDFEHLGVPILKPA